MYAALRIRVSYPSQLYFGTVNALQQPVIRHAEWLRINRLNML